MSEIGKTIKLERVKRGLSRDKLAEMANIATETLARYERGDRTPKSDVLEKIAIAMGISVAQLISKSDASPPEPPNVRPLTADKIITIPIFGRISAVCCGNGFYGADAEDPEDYLTVPASFAGSYDQQHPPFMVYAEGDSMTEAGILDGSQVIINPSEPVYDGDCALVEYPITPVTKATAIKRVYWLDNKIVEIRSACGDGWKRQFKVTPDEHDAPDDRLIILGKVMWTGMRPKRG